MARDGAERIRRRRCCVGRIAVGFPQAGDMLVAGARVRRIGSRKGAIISHSAATAATLDVGAGETLAYVRQPGATPGVVFLTGYKSDMTKRPYGWRRSVAPTARPSSVSTITAMASRRANSSMAPSVAGATMWCVSSTS